MSTASLSPAQLQCLADWLARQAGQDAPLRQALISLTRARLSISNPKALG